MRRLLAVAALFTAFGLVLGFYLRGGTPAAIAGQPEEKCAAENGDVNADGALDLSDGVTILNFLFQGNPTELVPLCDPPELTARIEELETQLAETQDRLDECRAESSRLGLPDTGQTGCYTCSSAAVCGPLVQAFLLLGQDSGQNTGCPNDATRFVDNGDGTVTDTCTRLMWQKNMGDTNENGTLTFLDDRVSWCGALGYCHDLVLAGHNDWRLPNIRELQSIIDYGRFFPATDPLFLGIDDTSYWSSTSWTPSPNLAWLVNIGGGTVDALDKGLLLMVRAVRNAPVLP